MTTKETTMHAKSNDTKPRAGYFYARSASREIACVHKHRTESAARKCADGIHHTASVIYVPDWRERRATR